MLGLLRPSRCTRDSSGSRKRPLTVHSQAEDSIPGEPVIQRLVVEADSELASTAQRRAHRCCPDSKHALVAPVGCVNVSVIPETDYLGRLRKQRVQE